MSDHISLEVNEFQRQALMKGLRFVRSSIMLTPEDPTDESMSRKARELEQIHELMSALSNGAPVPARV